MGLDPGHRPLNRPQEPSSGHFLDDPESTRYRLDRGSPDPVLGGIQKGFLSNLSNMVQTCQTWFSVPGSWSFRGTLGPPRSRGFSRNHIVVCLGSRQEVEGP